MPAYHVQRSTVINASADQVFDTVADFSRWKIWSPWLGAEKDAKVTVTDNPNSVGSIYRWQGDVVGRGEIEHQKLNRPTRIEDEIRFIKPFKSVSGVCFTLEPQGDATKITWNMNGKLPFFLFWMKSSMETFIGMDYERGLSMLKEYIETGEVLSDTDIVGVETVEAIDVFGVHDSCKMDDVGPVMGKAFHTTMAKLSENGISTESDVISIYHNTNLKERRFDFTSGWAVDGASQPPAPLVHRQIPSAKALHVRHTGSYENIGNSWSSAFQYARYKKLKLAKRDSYEIYRNDPKETPPAELVTDIYVPLK